MSFAFLGATRYNGTIDCSGGAGGSITGTTGFDALDSSAIATGATYPDATGITAGRGFFLQVTKAGTLTVDSVGECKVGDWIVSNGTTWQKLALEDVTGMVVIGDLGQNGFYQGTPVATTSTMRYPSNGLYVVKSKEWVEIEGEEFVNYAVNENAVMAIDEDSELFIEEYYTRYSPG